jgi:hypothetical protein
MRPSATTWYFAISGFLSGAAVSEFLWYYTGPEFHPVILGFRGLIHFFVFPFATAILAVFWARLLEGFFGEPRVGAFRGATVAVLSFISFNILLALYVAFFSSGPYAELSLNGVKMFLLLAGTYTVFGGIFFGWALILAGGVTGWFACRHVQHP